MTYHWVAFCDGLEVARGASYEEALGLAEFRGYKESDIHIKCVQEMPKK